MKLTRLYCPASPGLRSSNLSPSPFDFEALRQEGLPFPEPSPSTEAGRVAVA